MVDHRISRNNLGGEAIKIPFENYNGKILGLASRNLIQIAVVGLYSLTQVLDLRHFTEFKI